jgi:hypothetical protein
VSQGTTSGELAASLRQINGQRDKGKHPPNFHYRSKPFLHFHNGPDRTYADVRFGGDFEPVTASTPKQRKVLLAQVKAHVTAELASRQRKRGQGRKDGQNGNVRTQLLLQLDPPTPARPSRLHVYS